MSNANPTYELTVDGSTETVDDDGLLSWLSENFEPEAPEVDDVRRLTVGRSFGQDLDGFNGASWLVRRVA